MDAAEEGFHQALGYLGAEAGGDQVPHAHVRLSTRARQRHVEGRPADAAGREDPGLEQGEQSGRGAEDQAFGQGP